MKPYIHAQSSVKKFGGVISDYLELHNLMDSTKSIIGDNRHRAIFHSAFGIFLVEKILGINICNSDGKIVSVRDIAEQHILEDFHGVIPTLQDFLENMTYEPWMNGVGKPPSTKNLSKPGQVTSWSNKD